MMGQRHAFWPVLGARSEQHHGGVQGRLALRDQSRKAHREADQPELVAPAEAAPQVLEIDDAAPRQGFDQGFQLCLLDEPARSHDRLHAGCHRRAFHAQRPGGVIEYGRHPPDGRQRQDHADGSDHVGQQHADVFPVRGFGFQQARQRQAHAQDLSIGMGLFVLVFDQGGAAAVRGDGIKEALEQRLAGVGIERHRLHDRSQAPGRESAPAAGTAGRTAVDAGRAENTYGRPGENAPQQRTGSGAAEPLAGSLHMHRQHRGPTAQRDQRGNRVDLHHRPVLRQAAFREQHHRAACAQQAQDPLHAQRIVQVLHLMPDMGEEPPHEAAGPFFRRHDDDRIAREEQAEQQGIQRRMMVGNDQQAVGPFEGRQIAEDPYAQQQAQQQTQQDLHGEWQASAFVMNLLSNPFGITTSTKSTICNMFLRNYPHVIGEGSDEDFLKFLSL